MAARCRQQARGFQVGAKGFSYHDRHAEPENDFLGIVVRLRTASRLMPRRRANAACVTNWPPPWCVNLSTFTRGTR
jgi:hypothetical protein